MHTLVFKYVPDNSPPSGVDSLLSWQVLEARDESAAFRRYAANQIGELVAQAIPWIISRGDDLTVAWGSIDPVTTSREELEKLFRSLRPTLICPERPLSPEQRTADRWIISTHGSPTSLPTAAIQDALGQIVAAAYPRWQPRGPAWNAVCLLVRHDTDGESEKLVAPLPLKGDRLLARIANDPAVLSANRREDPALPQTTRDLLAVRLAAQRALGVPESDLAPMFSGQVSELMAVPMTRTPFDVQGTLAALRRRFQLYYGEHAELALRFVLDNCEFAPERVQLLKEAARAMAPAA
jgi:hypothetical protein